MNYAKRKWLDRVFAIVLTVMMVVAMFPADALRAYAAPVEGFVVAVTDGTDPISGAQVVVKNNDDTLALELLGTTDEDGNAVFNVAHFEEAMLAAGVESAEVMIVVSADGHTSKTIQHAIAADAIAQKVDISLVKEEYVTLTFVKSGNGVIKVDGNAVEQDTLAVEKDQEVVITFEPADDNTKVAYIKVNDELVETVPTVFAEDAKIEVAFETKYTVDVRADEGGTVTPAGQTIVNAGEKVTITATADEGYAIESIAINGVKIEVEKNAAEKEVEITPVEDTTVVVNFVRVFKVHVTYDGNGAVEVAGETVDTEGSISVYESEEGISVKAEPEAGYRVSKVTINGEETEYTANDQAYDDVLEAMDYELEFVFTENVYNVKVSDVLNGTVTTNKATVKHNGSVSVSVKPDENYEIASVTVNGESVVVGNKNSWEFTETGVVQDIEISATFVLKKYKVTFVADHGTFTDAEGEALVDNAMYVEHGSSAQFKFVPAEGYQVVSVRDGDVDVAVAEDIYTVENVVGEHTISAVTLDIEAPSVTPAVSDAEAWKTEKEITFVTSDNSNGTVDVYVSSVEYESLAALKEAGLESVTAHKVTANGTYYVYAVDEAENFTKTNIKVENIDREAPVASELVKENNGKLFNKYTTYTFMVTDAGSGVKSVSYGAKQDGSDAIVLTANDEGKYQFTVSANGRYYIFLEDNVGNKFSSYADVADVDTVAPVISELKAADQWNAESNDVTFKVTDSNTHEENTLSAYWSKNGLKNESMPDDITVIEIDENGVYKFAVEQNGTYYIYAVDQAENICVAEVVVAYIDTTAPVVDTIAKAPDVEWYNDSIEITGTVSDNQTDGVVAGSSVVKVVYSTTKDYADNLPEAEYSEGAYKFTVPASEFNGTYYVWAVDAVGRVSEANEINVKIDKTAPAIAAMSYVTEGQGFVKKVIKVLTFGLVFKDQVNISVQATDNRENLDSGIAKYQYQLVATGESLEDDGWVDYVSNEPDVKIKLNLEETDGFIGKVYVRVFDVAGNVAEAITDTEDGTTIVKDNDTPAVPDVNLNEYEAGAWTNNDVTITLSGSDTLSGVAVYQYRIEYADADKQNQDWIDMPLSSETQEQKAQHEGADPFVKDQIVVNADENATYYFRAVSNTGNASAEVSVVVKVQKTLPENATVTVAEPNGNNEWYVNAYPVIEITKPEVSAVASPVTTYYKFWDTNKGETEPADENKVMFTGDNAPVIEEDGVYFIKVWTEDEAGNICAEEDIIEKEIKVDITNPTELDITVGDKSVLPAEEGTVVFDTFYGETIAVKLSADCDISGLASLKYQKVASAALYSNNGPWEDYNAETGIVVVPNERFIIYFLAEDNAGNKTEIHSTGIVVDNKNPSGNVTDAAPDIVITPEDANKTESGIYNDDVTVSIDVFDPKYLAENGAENGHYSGLKEITYKIYTEDEPSDPDMVETGVLYGVVDGELVNKDGSVVEADGLVSEWSGKIVIDADKFNSNQIVVEITAIDNAGNERTSFITDIMVDVTAPVINITYDNDKADSDSYYNANRTATIVITERNFNAEDVVITIKNSDGVVPKVSDWVENKAAGNGDNTTYTATITYTADGDYEFEIEYTDLAENECTEINSGSTNPYKFTIDKTAPIIEVSYDNNNAENDKYFKATRTATVTITEHNFDVNRVIFTRDAARGGVVPEITWTHNGDTHVATILYDVDGDYTFDVKMTDKAGNASDETDYGTTVAGTDFVIDTTYADMIAITGVENGKAYGFSEVLIPKLSISDINLQEYKVTLVGIQKNATNDLTEEVNALLERGEELVTGMFNIFRTQQDMDGIYTLKVFSKDKAGNVDNEEVVFTVNRFGSVYVYDQYLMDLIADGGKYVYSVDGDLVITEYNADKLVVDSLKIEVTVDGRPLENVQYIVTPEINDDVAVGDSGWHEYKYTISKENFKTDGIYKIYISSEDATGNTPENTNYEDMGILFRVDSTKAEISSIVGLEENVVNAEEVKVSYSVFDTIGLKRIAVYVDGNLVDEITDFTNDFNSYNGNFTLTESKYAQSVQIVVEDMAGNITDTSAEDFSSAYVFNGNVTVSTDIFVRWYAHKGLFWGSISGVVVLAGALSAFIAAKRKKVKV